MDLFTYLGVAVPVALALLAINFELIKDSEYRRHKIRRKERERFVRLMSSTRGIGVDPEVNDYIRKLTRALESEK